MYHRLKESIEGVAGSSGVPSVRAALGEQVSGTDVVILGRVEVPDPNDPEKTIEVDLEALIGTGWTPPVDPADPSKGIDYLLTDEAIFGALVQGIADHFENEWKGKINALIQDYNTRFSTDFEEIP